MFRLSLEPADAALAAGERCVLACGAPPPARLAWRYSADAAPSRDHVLTHSDNYRKQLTNGSLLIEEMSASLAGQYQCVATVEGIGTIVSRIATVFLAEVPEFAEGPRVVAVPSGAAALLSCNVRAPPRLALRVLPAPYAPPLPERRVYGAARLAAHSPTLTLNVTWFKNGVAVRVEAARVSLSASGALELDPGGRGGGAASGHRGRGAGGGAALYRHAAPRHAHGSDLDSRFYLVGGGSLRIQSARALDSGRYTCRASNTLDSVEHSTQLHVVSAPRVSVPRGGAVVRAAPHGDAVLSCVTRGKPTPTLAWLKNGEPLSPNDHDIALLDNSSLRIQGVLPVDAGVFQCFVTSPGGSAAAAVRLLVVAPPPVPPRSNSTPATLASPSPAPDYYEDLDLGETSSAYTLGPDLQYDHLSYDYFHADEGPAVNATVVSMPTQLRAVIVKHRFVTLSWEEPEHKLEDITGYAVFYKVKGSKRSYTSSQFKLNYIH
ncbi:unnamed protein product [Leptidea sinapis]|uniref:Ig-like domain-containing protein n=1 Tax=Leptidea sinapis TaxID=189913 RepID=A0A5E4R4W5_9NEOP|nr:unnamed protein product [Leptidea sinapis]